MGLRRPCSPTPTVMPVSSDLLDGLFANVMPDGVCSSGEDCGTFFTALGADDSDTLTDELLFKLLGPLPDGLVIDRDVKGSSLRANLVPTVPPHATECNQSEVDDCFLARLRTALSEAIVAGDTQTAAAVSDAIRAEEASAQSTTRSSSAVRGDFAMRTADTTHTSVPHVAPGSQSSPHDLQSSSFQADVALKQLVQEGRCSPPVPPRSARPARCPRQAHCKRAPASARSNVRGQIAEQLKRGRSQQAATDAKPVSSELETELPQKPVRLGEICKSSVSSTLLLSAADQELCKDGGIGTLKDLDIERLPRDQVLEQDPLPQSDLPASGCAVISAWASGHISGAQALFELGATNLQAEATPRNGLTSWQTLSSVCSLPANQSFATLGPLWLDVFGQSPATVLHRALLAIRTEAGVVRGSITVEELHLGLRALELQALSDSDSSAERLQVQVWRELFRSYLRSDGCHDDANKHDHQGKEKDHGSLARVLAYISSIGAAGIEAEVRSLPLDQLREAPVHWDACSRLLSGMSRQLRDDREMLKTYGTYVVLGVGIDAADAELKRAYRDLCLKYHPDKGGDTVAFQQLQHAYEKIIEDRKNGIRPPPTPWSSGTAPSPPTPWSSGTAPSGKPTNARKCSETGPEANHTPRTHSDRAARSTGNSSASAPSPEEDAEAAAAAEIDSFALTAEALSKVEDFCNEARAAAERAQASSEAASAAAAVVESVAATGSGSAEEYSVLLEASPCLISATHATATDAEAVAASVAEVSTRLLPAGGPVADGERAEELVQASLTCSTQAAVTSNVAMTCDHIAREIAETFQTIGKDLELDDFDADAQGLALNFLASAAQRGRQAAKEAADIAALSAQVALQALKTARRIAHCTTTHKTRPPRPSRSASISRADAQQDEAGGHPYPTSSFQPQAGGRQSPAAGSHRGTESQRAEGQDWLPSGSPHGRSRSFCARSASPSARGLKEALVQRRLKSFKELEELNVEVCAMQREMHELLAQCPLFLPTVKVHQKERLFSVLGEYLQAVVISAGDAPSGSTSKALLAWLAGGACATSAICHVQTGALRMAAVLDMEALASVLIGQFLPALLRARPIIEKGALETAVKTAVESLRSWVVARDSHQ